MIDELLRRFPDILNTLIEKASQSKSDNPVVCAARNRLLEQLKDITGQLAKLSDMEGEKLTEEQVSAILSIPRPASKNLGWAFLQQGRGQHRR
jgi:hypothetical protein